MSPADGDVLCIPDPATFTQLPWKPEVAWLACNPYHAGEEIEQAPRNVLRRQMAALKEQGLEMKTGVELEFFLLDPDQAKHGQAVLGDPGDNAEKPCYDQAALMKRYDVISEIITCMESLGWGPYQADHEVRPFFSLLALLLGVYSLTSRADGRALPGLGRERSVRDQLGI